MNSTVEMFGHDFGMVWLLMGLAFVAVIVSFVVSLSSSRLIGAITVQGIGSVLLLAAVVLAAASWNTNTEVAFLTLLVCVSLGILYMFNTVDMYSIMQSNKRHVESESSINQ